MIKVVAAFDFYPIRHDEDIEIIKGDVLLLPVSDFDQIKFRWTNAKNTRTNLIGMVPGPFLKEFDVYASELICNLRLKYLLRRWYMLALDIDPDSDIE